MTGPSSGAPRLRIDASVVTSASGLLGDAIVSRTQFVEFGNDGFWAYDVALGVFLKHLIDAAEASGQTDPTWLSGALWSWRVACISDFGLTLDADWSAAQRQTFVALAEEACARLATRESIPAEEIVHWQILEDLAFFPVARPRCLR